MPWSEAVLCSAFAELTCLCQKMKVSLLWCGDTMSVPCWLDCSAASLKQYTTNRCVNISIQWNEVLVAKQSFGYLNCLMCIKLWKRFKVNHEYHKYCIFWIISSNKSTGNRKWRQAEWDLMSLIGVTRVSRWNYNLAVTWNGVHGKSWESFSRDKFF